MKSNKEQISDLCDKLSRDLVIDKKEDLINYGTSIEENMTYNYKKTLVNRFQSLQKEFKSIDKNGNSVITFDELYEFFHNKNSNISKEELEKIFYLFDRDQNQEITINEFVFSYIKLEEQLKLKREKLNNVRSNLIEKNEEFEKKKKLYEKEELNENNISTQSEATIRIKNGKNFKSIKTPSSKIILTLYDGKTNKVLDQKNTNLQPNTINPVFNEEFIFHVNSLDDYIILDALDQGSLGYKIGSTNIELKNYDNQLKNDVELKLNNNQNSFFFNNNNNNNNNNIKPTLNVRIRFRYNNFNYYDDIIQKTNVQISRLNEVLSELDDYKERFKQPFGLIVANKANELINEDFLHKEENPQRYIDSWRTSVYINGKKNNNIINPKNRTEIKEILNNNYDSIDYNESIDNIRNSLYRNSVTPNFTPGNDKNITPGFNKNTTPGLNKIIEEDSVNIITKSINNETNNNNNNNNNIINTNKSNFNNSLNNNNNNNDNNINNNINNNLDNNNNKFVLKNPTPFKKNDFDSNKDFTTNINDINLNNDNINQDISSNNLKQNDEKNNIFNIDNIVNLNNNKYLQDLNKIPTNNWKKYLSLGGLFLSLLNSFGRNDLISISVFIYSFIKSNRSENDNNENENNNFLDNIKYLLYSFYGSLGFDLFWLLFGESCSGLITLLSIINAAIKGGLVYLFSKVKNNKNNNKNNNN